MNKDLSKITSERIENVFDTFVVNKLLEELTPLKKEFERFDNQFESDTIRVCIENIIDSVSDIDDKVSNLRKNIGKNGEVYNYIIEDLRNTNNILDNISESHALIEEIKEDLYQNNQDTKSAINTLDSLSVFVKEKIVILLAELAENDYKNACDILSSIKESNLELIRNFSEHGEEIDNSLNLLVNQSKIEIEHIKTDLKDILVNAQKLSTLYEEKHDNLQDKIESSCQTVTNSIRADLNELSDKSGIALNEGNRRLEGVIVDQSNSLKEYNDNQNKHLYEMIQELIKSNNTDLVNNDKQIYEEFNARFERIEKQNVLIRKLQYIVLAVSGSALAGVLINVIISLI